MTTNTPTQQSAVQIEQTFELALAHHLANRLQEAEQLYRAILQTHPNHPEANHKMGVLAMQRAQPSDSLPYFMAALDANPVCPQYWLNAIDALFEAGQLEAAWEVLTIAQQQGLKGRELDALVERMKGHDQDHTKNPSPQEINQLVTLFNEGRYADAADQAKSMTERFPQNGFGWKVLGAVFKQMGQISAALEPMQKAAALSPNDADTHSNLGDTLRELGRLDEAEACCKRAIQINPNYAEAHNNLGITLQDQGRLGEAEASCLQAIAINPDYAAAHNNLGVIFQQQGRLNEAEASCLRAIQLKPDYAEAHNNLSVIFQELDRLNEAEICCRRALELMPNYVEAHNNLGGILHELGRLDEAKACCLKALQIRPNYAEAYNNLGYALQSLGLLNQAEDSFRQTLKINPNYADAYNNLGLTLQALNRLDEAEACYLQALKINPDDASAYNNLGSAKQSRGQPDQAMTYFRRALEVKPDYAMAHSNLIFALDMVMTDNPASLHEERKRWDATHAAHLYRKRTHANVPNPARRLRIGYISPDFRRHSAPTAFGGMLTHYDRSQFDVFAYSNLRGKSDDLTERFKQSVTVWRNIIGLSDDRVATLIMEDQIDILVDLSAHMAGNRLLVFARKPAPIQITAWGYAAGTGIQAIDVFFTDPVMVPPEQQQYFTEEIRYLPSVIGTFFIDRFPDVNQLPALSSNGVITFGSFNRLAKVSEQAYRAWAQILLAIPRSRLILKTTELDGASTREWVAGLFSKLGVTPEQIIMLGKTPWHEHMQAYHQIDIALDPFPHGGGVTALEGLMMGIPAINLCGTTVAGRGSASIMTTLGLSDWIAKSEDEYIELAIQKSGDLQLLAALRQQLRKVFNLSILGDQTAYARSVEQEYRKLWQEWCLSKT